MHTELVSRDKRYAMDPNQFLISEIFHSIQGEGKYAGAPSLFIRLCRCNRTCSFCDTEFNTINQVLTLEEMGKKLAEYSSSVNIIWTGGEPTLQFEAIENLKDLGYKKHDWHIETDGDFLCAQEGGPANGITYQRLFATIDYLVCSPKGLITAKKIHNDLIGVMKCPENLFESKVVTDLKTMNVELIPYATSLMPLSYEDADKTRETKKEVVEYCIKNSIRFTPRLQVDVWGFAKRGV